MNPEIFKQALKEAETELDQILLEEATLEERRTELERRAAKLTENIGHLAALTDDPTLKTRMAKMGSDIGMTNVVVQVLKAGDEPLTVSEIKNRIEKHGFTSDKYQNILATLHITLDRLCKNDGPVEKLRDSNGKKVYRPNPTYSPYRSIISSGFMKKALQEAIHPPKRGEKNAFREMAEKLREEEKK